MMVLRRPGVHLLERRGGKCRLRLGCHDREVIGWTATTAGIAGEMIRDLMIGCVESRFGTFKAPHQVQWLSDNGSIFTAARTLETATALGLLPCFTPVESPESSVSFADIPPGDRAVPDGGSLRRDLRARLCPRQPDPRCRARPGRRAGLAAPLQCRIATPICLCC